MLKIKMHTDSCTDRLQTEAVVSFIVQESLLNGVEGLVFEKGFAWAFLRGVGDPVIPCLILIVFLV